MLSEVKVSLPLYDDRPEWEFRSEHQHNPAIAQSGNHRLGTRDSRLGTHYFFLTLVPILNNFLTVPVGSRYI
jgi:hypothetical protein